MKPEAACWIIPKINIESPIQSVDVMLDSIVFHSKTNNSQRSENNQPPEFKTYTLKPPRVTQMIMEGSDIPTSGRKIFQPLQPSATQHLINVLLFQTEIKKEKVLK